PPRRALAPPSRRPLSGRSPRPRLPRRRGRDLHRCRRGRSRFGRRAWPDARPSPAPERAPPGRRAFLVDRGWIERELDAVQIARRRDGDLAVEHVLEHGARVAVERRAEPAPAGRYVPVDVAL